MMLLLSARLRRWLFVVLVLPLIGRVIEGVGQRVEPNRPRAGRAIRGAGSVLRSGRRGRRARRR
jgi:hypothetical protein